MQTIRQVENKQVRFDDKPEYMTITEQEHKTYDVSFMLTSHICLIVLAFFIASYRKELNNSLCVWIIFFPYAYITYVVVDVLTQPDHHCGTIR